MPPSRAWSMLPALGLAAAIVAVALTGTNRALFHALNGWSAHTGTALWGGLTVMGDSLVVLALCLPVVVWRPRWGAALLVAALLTTAVTHSFKPFLDLPRPARALGRDAITVIGPVLKRRAMPSGHAAAIMTAAGAFIPMLRMPWLQAGLLALALLVALSRVVVGAHWPLDVLVGALIGWLSGALAMRYLAPRLADGAWQRVSRGFAVVLAGCAIALPFARTGYPGSAAVQVSVALLAVALAAGRFVDGGPSREA